MNAIKDESGQTVVVVAAFLGIVALGFLALAVDVGYLFRERQMVQTAADAAAVAAAEEISNGTPGNEQTVAKAVAKLDGFDPGSPKNPATVTFPTPTGNFTGGAYVSVTVSKPVSTFFMGVFSSKFATQTVSATATAGGGQLSQTCVCIEGGSGTTLSMANNNQLIANGCGVVVNSSSSNAVAVAGSASITSSSLGLSSSATSWTSSNITGSSGWNASEINNGGSVTVNGVTNTEYTTTTSGAVPGVANCAPTMPPAPTNLDLTRCAPDPGGSSSVSSFTPAPYAATGTGLGGCYSGLTVGANGTTGTLASGIYVVTGNLHFTGTSSGYGVFFYLTSTGSLSIDNWASPTLVAGGTTEAGGATAPSLGSSYDGILFYQAGSSTVEIQGGSNASLRGAIYAPSATVNVGNGSTTSVPIGGLVANSLVMGTSGGAVLNVTNDTPMGSVSMGGSAKLVQ
jgi:Flp pilus assembly protein TadG